MAAVQVDIVDLLKALATEDLVNAVPTACLGRPGVRHQLCSVCARASNHAKDRRQLASVSRADCRSKAQRTMKAQKAMKAEKEMQANQTMKANKATKAENTSTQ